MEARPGEGTLSSGQAVRRVCYCEQLKLGLKFEVRNLKFEVDLSVGGGVTSRVPIYRGVCSKICCSRLRHEEILALAGAEANRRLLGDSYPPSLFLVSLPSPCTFWYVYRMTYLTWYHFVPAIVLALGSFYLNMSTLCY